MGGKQYKSSDSDTDTWREEMPVQINANKNTLLLWNRRPILLESVTENIWERKQNRRHEIMKTTLGGKIMSHGFYLAVTIPAEAFKRLKNNDGYKV